MKKNQIKFVGVCAAALLTVGALTPVASTVAHAQEAGIETKAVVKTENNLKPVVNVTMDDYYNHLEAKLASIKPLSTPVQSERISDPAWDFLWNKPANTSYDFVSLNLGLNDLDISLYNGSIKTPTGDRKAISQIFVKTDWLNSKEYVKGDKITLSFWAADASGDLVGSAPLATTVITLTGPTQDYDATAQNVTAAIGDQFTLNQNVVVNDKETGKALTYIDWSIYYPMKDQVITDKGDITVGDTTYDQGTWYTLRDVTMDGSAKNPFDDSADASVKDDDKRVKSEVNPSNNNKEYTYNKAVNFKQTLQAIVYSDTGKLADANIYFINRTINVVDDKEVQPVPLYRAYNSNDGDHLFTTSNSEYLNVTSAGWAAEGIAWNAASSTADGGYVVYRLYNSNSGEHFYTASKDEYMNLGKAGWTQEGVGFNSPKAAGNVAVYRAFNPNAKGPGSHMFTTSKSEYDNIVKAGWTAEGVAFYGLAEK